MPRCYSSTTGIASATRRSTSAPWRAREAEFRATSLTTLVQMVAGGSGVTLLPELAVPTEAARAGLSVRPIASSRAHRTIALVWRKRSPLAQALHEIGSVMRDAFPHAQDRRRAG